MFFDELDKKEESDTAYIQNKFENVMAHLSEIDEMINASSKGWKTSRMGKVDLTLIRLAVYEMKFEEDIPTGLIKASNDEFIHAYQKEEFVELWMDDDNNEVVELD